MAILDFGGVIFSVSRIKPQGAAAAARGGFSTGVGGVVMLSWWRFAARHFEFWWRHFSVPRLTPLQIVPRRFLFLLSVWK